MKNKQREQISSMDDFEDLTLFANESFDTEDVDLFEFTSEESSPLTRLKSIILSLDWEINDEILQELDDELHNLQPMWQNDKVAEVYLQGLKKIGNYIRTKGAYAHPNSIKLLLTFFYNFEKIISSEQITGDQITKLLKADVRKFKILQYQINLTDTDSQSPKKPKKEVVPDTIDFFAATNTEDIAKQLKAAVLSLDWEVTQESLNHFNKALLAYHQQVANNKPALVLWQGLQALGDYIADEKANAHPESFILLHSFNEALEKVTADGQSLSKESIQELLVDRINRLNNLKILIATPSGTLIDEHRIEEFVAGLSSPAAMDALDETEVDIDQPIEETVGPTLSPAGFSPAPAQVQEEPEEAASGDSLANELDSLFGLDVSMPAMESSDVQYPDEVLPMDAIQPVEDELADERIESHLGGNRGIKPALADADEASGFDENAQPLDLPIQSDLADQLDLLFADASNEASPALSLEEEDEDEVEEVPELYEGPIATLTDLDNLTTEENEHPAPASGTDGSKLAATSAKDVDLFAIESKLDSFFGAEDLELSEKGPATPASVEEIEQSLYFAGEDAVQAALADSNEEQGFSEEAAAAALDTPPTNEIEERLDLFFGTVTDHDTDTAILAAATKEPDLPLDADQSDLDVALAALSAEEALDEPPRDLTTGDQELDLTGALDQFFAEDQPAARETLTMDEAQPLVVPALAANAEPVTIPSAPAESLEVQLATLGALLPGLVRTPSRDQVAQVADKLTTLKDAPLSVPQQSLAALLESVLTMLIRLPAKDAAATEKLVNFLYQQLSATAPQPDALPQAILQFNQWLQQASAVMPVVPAASADIQNPQLAYTAKELYFELAELRGQIRDEFARLRHDLHHHK